MTLAAILQEEPRPPSDLVPAVPRELERLLQACLRKDPARLGGAERRPAYLAAIPGWNTAIAWSADSKRLIVSDQPAGQGSTSGRRR
jgi:hypothetical protein